MQPKNLFAVVFITSSLALGSLAACAKGGEAVEVKNPSADGLTPGVGESRGATADKSKTPGATAQPDTKGAMGGGTDRALGGDSPKGGPAPTARHPTGPGPANTGDPPPDPNRH